MSALLRPLLALLLAARLQRGGAAGLRAAQPLAADGAAAPSAYLVERAQPEAPNAAPLCLTAGQEDTAGGVGLDWRTCQEGRMAQQPAVLAAQRFSLEAGGRLRAEATGLCVRRAECGQQAVYDLGECDGPGRIAEFLAWRPRDDSPWHSPPLGHPSEAVARDRCEVCGPYLLVERCRSEGGPANGAGGCGNDWRAAPGWTKTPVQYVGEAAVEGQVQRRSPARDLFAEVAGLFSASEAETSGLGNAGGEGVCGSHVVDGPRLESIFYLRRA